MSESVVGILVFAAVAIVVSLLCHRALGSFGVAILVSGPAAAIAFQILVYLRLGYQPKGKG